MPDLSAGACAGMADDTFRDSDPFYPDPPKGPTPKNYDPYAAAKKMCDACPIRDLCLQDALTDIVQWGYRAGMTGEERQSLKRKHRRAPSTARNTPSDADLEMRMALYHQGLTDPAIAARVGLQDKAISAWRKRNSLMPNYPMNPPHTAQQVQTKWDLYQKGATDKVIATAIGVSPDAIRRWRRKENLETNRTRMKTSA